MQVAVTRDAFVGLLDRRSGPRSIVMKRPTSLAVRSGRVVFTVADLPPVDVRDAPMGVSVALAPTADGEVCKGVEPVFPVVDPSFSYSVFHLLVVALLRL